MATVPEVLNFMWEYSYGGRCDGGWVDRSAVHTYFARTEAAAELIRSMVVSGLLHTANDGTRLAINTEALTPTARRQMQDGASYRPPAVHAVGGVRLIPDDDGVAVASGPDMSGFDPHTDEVAYLSAGQNQVALDFALSRAAKAAAAGKHYERKVTGEDVGDVLVLARPETGDVELRAVPWADEPEPEDEQDWTVADGEVPRTTLDDDDNEIELTEAQRAAWAKELQEELDAQREAARPAPPPSRSAVLSLDQVEQLRTVLNAPRKRVPSGVPDVG